MKNIEKSEAFLWQNRNIIDYKTIINGRERNPFFWLSLANYRHKFMVFAGEVSFNSWSFVTHFGIEHYIQRHQCHCFSGWKLSSFKIYCPWSNIDWLWRALMVPTLPISSAEIAELVPTHTGHMIASLVFLYNKHTICASFHLKISFQ